MNVETIIEYLKGLRNISEWTLETSHEEALETFFSGRRLDMARSKAITRNSLTVHVDSRSKEGAQRGSAIVSLPPNLELDELADRVNAAIRRAQVSPGPAWGLASERGIPQQKSNLQSIDLAVVARTAEGVVFSNPSPGPSEGPHFQAVELFVTRRNQHLVASTGSETSWTDILVETELVASAGRGASEVELTDFWSIALSSQEDLETLSLELGERARRLLHHVDLRSAAGPLVLNRTAAAEIPVLLSGEAVPEFFNPLFFRSQAAQIRSGACDSEIGKPILHGNLGGDPLTLGFDPFQKGCPASRPVDPDAFPLRRTVLVEKGTLRALEGPVRHAAALSVPPQGTCSSRWVLPGSMDLSNLSTQTYLEALTFSDFYMDVVSGEFGGELRLAILHQKGKQTPMTGGSISGSLSIEQEDLRFSSTLSRRGNFVGPSAVLIRKPRITEAR
jgi:PmbA protein